MPKKLRAAAIFIFVAFFLSLSSTAWASTYTVKPGDSLWGIAYNNSITVDALKSANELNSDLIHPGQTLAIPGSSNTQDEKKPGERELPSRQQTSEFGDYLDWSQAQTIYTVGSTATITDVSTGLTFQVKRRGGTNHADSEPHSAADTAIMREAYGGSWSWEQRAIIVSVNGRDMAASMNGMPHGRQNIHNNNFSGHFCIHFKNSRTHNTNSLHSGHQDMVKRAAGLH